MGFVLALTARCCQQQLKASFVGSFQLGPVTPNLIQAKHTSAVGQTESVNFNIKPAFMDQGCHIEVSDPFSCCILFTHSQMTAA